MVTVGAAIEQIYIRKLEKVGKILCEKLGMLIEAQVGHDTPLSEAFTYKIKDNQLQIYATTAIVMFIEKGVKPHIIRPKKPGGSLKFRTTSSGTRRNGQKYEYGDDIITKIVHHPGFEARPFISAALFTSKPQIMKVLVEGSDAPALTFVLEGSKITLL